MNKILENLKYYNFRNVSETWIIPDKAYYYETYRYACLNPTSQVRDSYVEFKNEGLEFILNIRDKADLDRLYIYGSYISWITNSTDITYDNIDSGNSFIGLKVVDMNNEVKYIPVQVSTVNLFQMMILYGYQGNRLNGKYKISYCDSNGVATLIPENDWECKLKSEIYKISSNIANRTTPGKLIPGHLYLKGSGSSQELLVYIGKTQTRKNMRFNGTFYDSYGLSDLINSYKSTDETKTLYVFVSFSKFKYLFSEVVNGICTLKDLFEKAVTIGSGGLIDLLGSFTGSDLGEFYKKDKFDIESSLDNLYSNYYSNPDKYNDKTKVNYLPSRLFLLAFVNDNFIKNKSIARHFSCIIDHEKRTNNYKRFFWV